MIFQHCAKAEGQFGNKRTFALQIAVTGKLLARISITKKVVSMSRQNCFEAQFKYLDATHRC